MPAKFEKPRPRPPKAEPTFWTLSEKEREVLAEDVQYLGSPHHTDVPKSPTENTTGWINNLLVTPAKAGVVRLRA
jgi:hypothetical protein